MEPVPLTGPSAPSGHKKPDLEDRQRIGLYGGTFDPIHFGHLAVARDVQAQFGLDQVLFIPAAQSPFRNPPIASSKHRLAMVQLAVADTEIFRASAIDIQRSGPSFMIDTVETISAQHPKWDLFILIGADAFRELPAWRRSGDLLKSATFIVVPRSSFSTTIPDELSDQHSSPPANIHVHHMPPIDISASSIREQIAQDLPIDSLVPATVDRYINSHRLYQESESS
ncbi:MAG: nicotinate (nicotinamide) nucleotide adenylyltransferase [Chloroflexi bacterium]|nr:nicotinate (nicotinamide) nucleotide adenylyltransferase [Chloroflexota bacterium]|tara:strand:+ start:5834 stop:6511 length:678 start_codon:yes stop_codon:yes gene_type:complete